MAILVYNLGRLTVVLPLVALAYALAWLVRSDGVFWMVAAPLLACFLYRLFCQSIGLIGLAVGRLLGRR